MLSIFIISNLNARIIEKINKKILDNKQIWIKSKWKLKLITKSKSNKKHDCSTA